MVAMPKFNMYQALHTTVIGPEGRPLEIQIRTRDMHETAEYGVAAHWRYKEGGRGGGAIDPTDAKLKWLKSLLDWQSDVEDPQEFADSLRDELIEDEVFVFTPKGEVKSLAAGATPLDFAYEVHTDVGHRCVGAKVNGKLVPLHYELQSGDIVEVLTSKRERGPSRDWLAMVKTTRARNKIRAWFKAESREDSEHSGREQLQEQLKKAGLPAQKITGSALLADVIREMGFRKADDFYIALGGAKISAKVVVNKVMQRLKEGEAAEDEPTVAEDLVASRKMPRRPEGDASKYGIRVEGVEDVPLRLAKCCRPVSGDAILGYVSLGRGITIHREDCPNAAALRKDPERFVPVSWDGDSAASFKVELQVDGWDRHRLLEDLSRTFAEPASTSSRRAASSRIRWSRTGSWSRWGHPHAEVDDHAAPRDRCGVRRVPRHADRRLSRAGAAPRLRARALGDGARCTAPRPARARPALLRIQRGHRGAADPARGGPPGGDGDLLVRPGDRGRRPAPGVVRGGRGPLVRRDPHAGHQRGLEVKLSPLAVRPLLGVGADELAGRVVPSTRCWAGPGASSPSGSRRGGLARALRARRRGAGRAARAQPRTPPDVVAAWRRLAAAHGGISIGALARRARLEPASLRRAVPRARRRRAQGGGARPAVPARARAARARRRGAAGRDRAGLRLLRPAAPQPRLPRVRRRLAPPITSGGAAGRRRRGRGLIGVPRWLAASRRRSAPGGDVDLDAFAAHLDWLLERGLDGAFRGRHHR
jgi:hypothetical protein